MKKFVGLLVLLAVVTLSVPTVLAKEPPIRSNVVDVELIPKKQVPTEQKEIAYIDLNIPVKAYTSYTSLQNHSILVHYKDGSVEKVGNRFVQYTSTDDFKVMIGDYGVIYFKGVGTATLTGTYRGISASQTINVVQKETDYAAIDVSALNHLVPPSSTFQNVELTIISDGEPINDIYKANYVDNQLRIYDIDWENKPTYQATIQLENYIFSLAFTPNEKNEVVAQLKQEDFQKVEINIPETYTQVYFAFIQPLPHYNQVSHVRENKLSPNQKINRDFYKNLYVLKGDYSYEVQARAGQDIVILKDEVSIGQQPLTIDITRGDIKPILLSANFKHIHLQKSRVFLKHPLLSNTDNTGAVMNIYKTDSNVHSPFRLYVNDKTAFQFDWWVTDRGTGKEYAYVGTAQAMIDTEVVHNIDDTFKATLMLPQQMEAGRSKYLSSETKDENFLSIEDSYGNQLDAMHLEGYDLYTPYYEESFLNFMSADGELNAVSVLGRTLLMPEKLGKYQIQYTYQLPATFDAPAIEFSTLINLKRQIKRIEATENMLLSFSKPLTTASLKQNIFIVADRKNIVTDVTIKPDSKDPRKVHIVAPPKGYKDGVTYQLVILDGLTTKDGHRLVINEVDGKFPTGVSGMYEQFAVH
ncbi:hypothetical protein [Metalysinibacillus jejuensis]|uniref:hypothetical protein n=1 Tax=Metalysinibacillus jejuensis TaxID=914327 RepID=UPI000D3B6C2A|nr:hypothetical protein [Metalysinibacillus jejuensis]